jgi:Tol biopolymer transport system component/DNA-binding winged helix-turn-helix (wHTH) protein
VIVLNSRHLLEVVVMSTGVRNSQTLRFATFELDPQTGELRKGGLKLKLTGQPFQVLVILLDHAGQVVTREEFQNRLWPDTFVDFDHNLNTAINKIREVLGDSAERPRFVETLPRRGYRFIVPVEKSPSSEGSTEKTTARSHWIAVGGLALLALSGIAVWLGSRKTVESSLFSGEAAPLTALPGVHAYPSFSPDGNQVAFVIEGENGQPGIYTAIVGGEKALRLTSNPGDSSPTWSSDGTRVAFTRYSPDNHSLSIMVVPALGGSERKLYTFPYRPPDSTEWINWSPGGDFLAFEENRRVQLLSAADYSTQPLTSPPDGSFDYAPTFSPNGKKVAFVRGTAGGDDDLFVVSIGGGEPKRLTFDRSTIYGPSAWTPDGYEIVFSSSRRGLHNLWSIPVSGGTPKAITSVVSAANPSISRKGDLAYLQQLSNDNIWRLGLKDPVHAQGPATPVISAKWQNTRPDLSPDGKRVAFESDRSGYSEIWNCDSNGSNCGQLTSLKGAAKAPHWSPDGRRIAFEFQPGEHRQIYVVDVPGGLPKIISTFPDSNNLAPSWSKDGSWIYFASDHAKGTFDLWKVAAKGGSPLRITKNGGTNASESSNGPLLYYSKPDSPGIWNVSAQGGDERFVLDQPSDPDEWALGANGIYFVHRAAVNGTTVQARPSIEFLEFATGKVTPIFQLDTTAVSGLTVSPDRTSILFVRNEFYESSIMLVRGLR